MEQSESTWELMLRLYKVSQITEAHSKDLEAAAYEKGYRAALQTVWTQFFPGTDIYKAAATKAELDGDTDFERLGKKGRIPKC